MPKVRLFFQEKIKKSKKIFPSFHQIHYLKNVMRKKDGDKIFIFDGEEEWSASLKVNKKISIFPTKLLRTKSLVQDIWICFGLVKLKNINTLIEKVTEIGTKKFYPLATKFSEKINLNFDRLEKIIIESVEQSNALSVPTLEKTINIRDFLKDWDEERVIVFCDERSGGKKFSTLPLGKYKKFAIFVGPVGGWSNEDLSLFENKKNFFKVTLGTNILKADTAAIYSLSCLKNFLM